MTPDQAEDNGGHDRQGEETIPQLGLGVGHPQRRKGGGGQEGQQFFFDLGHGG